MGEPKGLRGGNGGGCGAGGCASGVGVGWVAAQLGGVCRRTNTRPHSGRPHQSNPAAPSNTPPHALGPGPITQGGTLPSLVVSDFTWGICPLKLVGLRAFNPALFSADKGANLGVPSQIGHSALEPKATAQPRRNPTPLPECAGTASRCRSPT